MKEKDEFIIGVQKEFHLKLSEVVDKYQHEFDKTKFDFAEKLLAKTEVITVFLMPFIITSIKSGYKEDETFEMVKDMAKKIYQKLKNEGRFSKITKIGGKNGRSNGT